MEETEKELVTLLQREAGKGGEERGGAGGREKELLYGEKCWPHEVCNSGTCYSLHSFWSPLWPGRAHGTKMEKGCVPRWLHVPTRRASIIKPCITHDWNPNLLLACKEEASHLGSHLHSARNVLATMIQPCIIVCRVPTTRNHLISCVCS